MTYTTIIVQASKIDDIKRDYLVKSGFIISGATYIRSVKSSELHMVINTIASKSIAFNLQTSAATYNSKPCTGCRK